MFVLVCRINPQWQIRMPSRVSRGRMVKLQKAMKMKMKLVGERQENSPPQAGELGWAGVLPQMPTVETPNLPVHPERSKIQQLTEAGWGETIGFFRKD